MEEEIRYNLSRAYYDGKMGVFVVPEVLGYSEEGEPIFAPTYYTRGADE